MLPGIYDQFVQRLVEASRSLKIGPAEDPSTSVGPLIDEDSVAAVAQVHRAGAARAAQVLAVDVGALADEGFYVGPHIFADVPASRGWPRRKFSGRCWRCCGRRFRRGLADRQRQRYALTGGLFCAVRRI